MSSVFFGNAARIIKAVFDWGQTSSQGKTSNLIIDAFKNGIDNSTLAGEGFTLVPGTSPLSVTVQGQGIAYDSVGARIFLSSSDTTSYNPANVTQTTNDGLGNFILTPQSSGCVNIPLTGSSFNYLWIDYLATTDITAFTLNEITNAKIFYKLTDGYNITVTTVNTPPDSTSIFLGTIDLTSISSGIIPSSVISQIGRTYFNILPNIVPITTAQANRSDATTIYNPASMYTLEAHIKAVGTSPTGVSPTNPHAMTLADLGISSLDTVVGHRQLEHGVGGGLAAANAIIAGIPGTPYPTTSAMATSINIVNPGSDYITVHQLLSSEFALINGTAFNVTDIFGAIPVNANVFFPNTSGTYNVFYDSIVKSFSLSTSDISSDATKLWLCTVTYTFVGTGPSDHNALSALIDRRRIGSSTHLLQRWFTNARPGSGTTAAVAGEFGFNLTTGLMEFWDGSAWQSPITGTINGAVPTGTILEFAGSSAPLGFLMASGGVVSQTTYANLFSVIGVTYNTGGEGAGNFRLPNKIDKVGVGTGGSIVPTLGSTAGATTETPTEVAHEHVSPVSHAPGSLTTANGEAVSGTWPYGSTTINSVDRIFVAAGDGGVGNYPFLNTSPTAATINPVSVVQPSIGLNYIIKY